MEIVLYSLALSAWFAWEAAGWLRDYLHSEMLYKLLDSHCQRAAILEILTDVAPKDTPLFNFSRPYLEDIMDINWTYSATAMSPTFHPMWLCTCGHENHEGRPVCPVCGVIRPHM